MSIKSKSTSIEENLPIINGSFVSQRYMKCPHLDKQCKWRMSKGHASYSYLDNACYLAGSFNLQCP